MISIVIVSYNTKRYTKECIESIYERVKTGFELIVVDNNSTDGSRELLKKMGRKYGFELVALEENVGFGRGNNEGAIRAKGKWLFFLNSDTVVKNDIVKGLRRLINEEKDLGVLGIKLVGVDGVVQSNGGFAPRWWRVLSWMLFVDDLPWASRVIRPVHPKGSFYKQRRELDWVTGAGLLIKKDYFTKAGGFDPRIFMYCEDMDLCLAVRKLGRRVVYTSKLHVVHFGGKSSSNENALYSESVTLPYVIEKHYGSLEGQVGRLFIKLGALLRLFIFGIIFYDEAKVRAYKRILA